MTFLLNPYMGGGGPPSFVCPTILSLPAVSAAHVLVRDITHGCVLYEKDADTVSRIASVSKLGTALLLMQWKGGSLSDTATITSGDLSDAGSVAGLMADDVLTYDSLLKCLLIASGGDAANCIARTLGGDGAGTGGWAGFVSALNGLAATLGMADTTFINPHGGAAAQDNTATARDVVRLATAAFADATILAVAGTATDSVSVAGPNARTLGLTHTAAPIEHGDAGYLAAKTGIRMVSGQVGYHLASLYQAPDGSRIITVNLQSDSDGQRTRDHRRLVGHAPLDYPYLDPLATLDVADPNWGSVVLLVGADDGTIVDESAAARTLTNEGATIVDGAARLVGARSMAFDGTDDRVEMADHADLSFGSGDFVVECFFSAPSTPGAAAILLSHNDSTGNQREWNIYYELVSDQHRLVCAVSYNGSTFSTAHAVINPILVFNGNAHHLAVVRNGASLTVYVNGEAGADVLNVGANTLHNSTAKGMIGARQNGAGFTAPWPGRIDEVRITKGVARYTGNFISPRRPFPRHGP